MSIKMGVAGFARRWVDARPQVVMDHCHCGLGCPDRPTGWGFNRHMEWVPLALGHGRKLGDGS